MVHHALDPRCAAAVDAPRDGWRPGRGGPEALEAVDVARKPGAGGHARDRRDADLPGACAPLSHAFSRPRIGPRPGRELRQPWRQAGAWEHGPRPPPTAGPPPGGGRSPGLATRARAGRAKPLGPGDRGARAAAALVVLATRRPARAPTGGWRALRSTPAWCSGPRALMASGCLGRGAPPPSGARPSPSRCKRGFEPCGQG